MILCCYPSLAYKLPEHSFNIPTYALPTGLPKNSPGIGVLISNWLYLQLPHHPSVWIIFFIPPADLLNQTDIFPGCFPLCSISHQHHSTRKLQSRLQLFPLISRYVEEIHRGINCKSHLLHQDPDRTHDAFLSSFLPSRLPSCRSLLHRSSISLHTSSTPFSVSFSCLVRSAIGL